MNRAEQIPLNNRRENTPTPSVFPSAPFRPKTHGAGTSQSPVSPSLLAICQAIGSKLELGPLLSTILEMTMQEMKAQEGSILLINPSEDRLEMIASSGLPSEIIERGYVPRRGSIAEWVIENGEPMVLNGIVRTENYTSFGSPRYIVSAICIPLKIRGIVIGTINLNRTDPMLGPFIKSHLDAMVILSSQAAISIEMARLHEANLRSERLAAIGQTVAGVSHCVKNILTGLRGGISISEMASRDKDWDTLDGGLDILKRSINRISTLMFDMLDYSKERTPECTQVDLRECLDEILSITSEKASQRNNLLVVEIADDAAQITADSTQIFRCLLNLVQNALDANPDNGRVIICSRRDASDSARRRLSRPSAAAIVIEVSDCGPGVAAEHYPKLFEPFFSTKGSQGTGLGLAVSRKLIREHGGEMELISKPGEPATFAIYLPEPTSMAHLLDD